MDVLGCLTAGDFLGQEARPAGRAAQPALPSMADRAEGFTSALRVFPCSVSRPLAAGEEAACNEPQVEAAA